MEFDDVVSQRVYDKQKLGFTDGPFESFNTGGYIIVFTEDEEVITNPALYDILTPPNETYPSLYAEIDPLWYWSEEHDNDHLDIKFRVLMYIAEAGGENPLPQSLVRRYPEWTETVPDGIALAKDWLHPETHTADTGLKEWVRNEIRSLVLEYHTHVPVN